MTGLLTRRQWLATSAALAASGMRLRPACAAERPAQIAITLDLEMSRDYPVRGYHEWDFQKGNLDDATKTYSVEAARRVKAAGGKLHFFCVGRVLEQPDVEWLKTIDREGHPVGNHTYDHVYVLAKTPEQTQFRFQRSPWLIAGRSAEEIIRENIRLTSIALKARTGIVERGFRTPGGFQNGLKDRPDVQQWLLDAGFRWVSSLYPAHQNSQEGMEPSDEVYASIVTAQAAAQPFVYPNGLIEIPMSPISDVGAFRNARWQRSWFLKAVRLAVEWAIQTGSVFDFLAHPSCLVIEDPQFEAIELICDLVRNSGGKAQFATLDDIAKSVVVRK